MQRLLKVLRGRGAFAEKIHGGNLQRRGLPDIIVCYGGYFMGLEVKRKDGEQPTPLQRHVLDEITVNGYGYSGVIYSEEQLERVLNDFPLICRGCLEPTRGTAFLCLNCHQRLEKKLTRSSGVTASGSD